MSGKIVKFTAPEREQKPNPYVEAVTQLAAAPEGSAYELTVDNGEPGKTKFGKNAAAQKMLFAAAAREIGHTANTRLVSIGESKTAFTFTLGPLRKSGPRGPRNRSAEGTEEATDATE